MKKESIIALVKSPFFWIAVVVILLLFLGIGRKARLFFTSIFSDAGGDKRFQQQSSTEENVLENLGMKQSYFDSWYETSAKTIHDSLKYIGDTNQDEENAKNVLMKLNNDLDVLKLVKAFGTRCETFFWICNDGEKDLFNFVRGSLEPWRIKQINENWSNKPQMSYLI